MEAVLFQKEEEMLQINEKTLKSLPYEDKIIYNVVTKIKEQGLLHIKEDTLGILFERLIKEEERKNLGQFYTPQEIVEYMIDYLNIKPNSKILDPTCGCGVFLVTAYNFLKRLNNNALDNIYGVDLNESATKITRINLWLRNGQNQRSLQVLENNIKIGNSIVEDKNIDYRAFNWREKFVEIIDNGGFDFVIGNPPYVTLKNNRDYNVNESVFSSIANGSTNAASLVIAKSFELVKDGGIMAFVLPKTLLRVNSYSKLRKFLLKNAKILHIYDLGNCFSGVRGEQIILFFQKSKNEEEIKNNNVLIRVFEDKKKALKGQKEFVIPQCIFKKYNNFLMFEDQRYYELVEKINNSGQTLENFVDIFRGLTISPSSPLITNLKAKENAPIIKGNNISKFSHYHEYFINIRGLTKNISKLEQFRNDKIILQNIFSSESGIISTIDANGDLTFDTVTNLVLKDKTIDMKYVLGLLNSKLINFFLMYAIYNKSKLTMHTDKVYVGKLPIKIADNDNQREVVELVNKLEKAGNKKALLRELDNKVYRIYGIGKTEQNLIDESLKKTMSKRSAW